MDACIFCKILKGEISSSCLWEDEHHYAFLDLFPNTKGQTLVIPKKHIDSQVFELNNESYTQLMLAAKSVGELLKEKLQIERVGLIIEGMGVNHAHVKLYPMHGLTKDWRSEESDETVFYENYPGFLSSQMGTILTDVKRENLLKTILN